MTRVRWIRSLFVRERMDRDLADEIAQHIEEKAEQLVAAGLTRDAAVREARRAFGNITGVREESRDVWRWRAGHDMASDVRYAIRQLRHNRSFAGAAILTLAIGIGANSAIFSVVNAVVFRSLPYHEPAALVSVASMDPRRGAQPISLSYFTFFEFRRAGVFERIASYRDTGLTLTGRDLPAQLDGQLVSWDLFDLLGVPPLRGRGFVSSDEAPGARVVILSYHTWQTYFGGDPSIVGRPIMIDGEPNTVVGVAQRGFTYPIRSRPVEIWTTLARDASSATVQPITEQRGARLLNAVARLAPGTTREQAHAQLNAVAARLAAEHPATHKNLPGTDVRPELESMLGPARQAILVLWGAVALVLLIACANIANMLLARTADRQHELSVRAAIGGSRGRIVRQLLTENLTIAAIGASMGIAGAAAIVRLLVVMTAEYLPRATEIRIDAGVLLFTAGLGVAVCVLVSVPPALWIGRAALGRGLAGGSRAVTVRHERLRGALVVAQVSVGLMLLSVASILGSGFVQLTRRDLGFAPGNLLTFRAELTGSRYTTERQVAFIDTLLERLAISPGISSAAVGMPLPLVGNEMAVAFNIEERPAAPSERPSSNMALVSPEYFQTIGTPIIEGRGFTNWDDESRQRVLIVNKAFAEKFFPGVSALGKRIASGATSNRDAREGGTVFREIVGVVGNARQSPGGGPEPIYYFPYKQMPWGPPSVIVRTTLPDEAILPAIRRTVAELDPNVPVHGAKSMAAIFATGIAPPRFVTMLMGSFAAIGLLLTATGLYGLLSYAVARRTREIGVRIALGATRRSIVSMILGRALRLTAIGTALGIAGMLAGRTLLTQLIVVFDPPHPTAWLAAAVAIVAMTAIAAAYPPARRAASIEPTSALRME
ncbi:MAG TPA: ABC transporter permease [Vicinamibacterales bacterium]|nr:ABC transporter permease [Vicinamibacterales bacterium]